MKTRKVILSLVATFLFVGCLVSTAQALTVYVNQFTVSNLTLGNQAKTDAITTYNNYQRYTLEASKIQGSGNVRLNANKSYLGIYLGAGEDVFFKNVNSINTLYKGSIINKVSSGKYKFIVYDLGVDVISATFKVYDQSEV